jgi:hypothetical protein
VRAGWVVPSRAVVVQGKGREEGQQDTCDHQVGDDLNSARQGKEDEEKQKGDQYEHRLTPLFAARQEDDVGAD